MPTIQLTQPQTHQLSAELLDQIQYLTHKIINNQSMTTTEMKVLRHTLSEVHHLLEASQ